MFEKKKWRVSSAHKNQKGQVTTVTITTEDETVVRKMLEDPDKNKSARPSNDDAVNVKYKTASKEKKAIKQLPSPKKKVKTPTKPKKKLSRSPSGKLTLKNKPSSSANPEGLFYGRFRIIQHPGRSWDLIDTKDPRYNPNKKESSGIISSIYDFGTSTLSQIIHEFDEKMQEVLNEKNN